jgi:hypothetical protein
VRGDGSETGGVAHGGASSARRPQGRRRLTGSGLVHVVTSAVSKLGFQLSEGGGGGELQ